MKIPELLAPAGGKEQYIAAVENGADAVYAGGHLFNARMKADNFRPDELKEMIDYGHLRNVKTYIALNTLIDDNSIDRAVSYAGELYSAGADALIIQDLGLGRLIHENYPDLPLHLSTQATIYNIEGVRRAAALGYERVVPARELSLDEIRECCASDTEIEIFVHGALCMCYSGQCQLSRYIGGRSGNRGACAQPCRLPYSGGYPLSPKDICTLDIIPQLVDAGAASFKIEGRMKSPQYVAAVTSIYRKYIDMTLSGDRYRIDEKDRETLLQVFNRGGFMTGYASGDPGSALLSGSSPKNMGVYIGEVRNYNRGLIDVCCTAKPDMGDVLEINSENGRETMTLTYMKQLGSGLIRMGDIRGHVHPGDSVYRIVSKSLSEKMLSSFARPSKKAGISVTLTALEGDTLRLTAVDDLTGISVHVEDGLPVEKAKNKAADEEYIAGQLKKTGDTPFEITECTISADEGVFLAASRLNSARRKLLDKLTQLKAESFRREEITPEIMPFDEPKPSPGLEICAESLASYLNAVSQAKQYENAVPVLPLRECMDNPDIDAVPYLPQVTKGACDIWLRSDFDNIVSFLKKKDKGIYIGNISWIRPFHEAGITVFGDYGLNRTNRFTSSVYIGEGASYCIDSLENASSQTEGAFPLMITEHEMNTDSLTDRMGLRYKVSFDSFSHKTTIRPDEKMPDPERIISLSKDRLVRIYV